MFYIMKIAGSSFDGGFDFETVYISIDAAMTAFADTVSTAEGQNEDDMSSIDHVWVGEAKPDDSGAIRPNGSRIKSWSRY